MVESDRKKFGVMIAGIYDFWERNLSDMALAIWWETLKHLEVDVIEGALFRHMQNPDTGKFIPKPSDVLEQVGGTTADASMLAWSKVVAGQKQWGTHESVAFDDPIIHRVMVDLGGWVWFGQQLTKDLPFIEKRFRDAYRAWLRRGIAWDPITHLPGLTEQTNRGMGFHESVAPPKLIGDRPAAAKIAGIELKQQGKLTEAKT